MHHATATPLIRHRLEKREDSLSPHAARSAGSRGRAVREEPSPMRTEFQRDRDRIVHSKAFRRLKHKTQVFIAPQGDHYVTRLTHTFEVAQIARSISRALDLNEDLTEAIALGHDLGHTPFGHIGEDELNSLLAGGFRHNRQSLRVVDTLEKGGRGLNLTSEVRQGIVSHSKPRGDFLDSSLTEGLTAEAQVVRISDAVAYLNHDLADAFRAGVLDRGSLPGEVVALGDRHSQRINTMVTDIVQSSWSLSGLGDETLDRPPAISMSPGVRKAVNVLREFMFQRVYVPEDTGEEGRTARKIVRLLHGHFTANPSEVPAEFHGPGGAGGPNVVDYVAGMTDRYAIRTAESIEPGTAGIFLERLV